MRVASTGNLNGQAHFFDSFFNNKYSLYRNRVIMYTYYFWMIKASQEHEGTENGYSHVSMGRA